MLKSQIYIFAGGGGGVCGWPTFDAFAEGGGWPTFDAKSKNPKFTSLQVGGGGGGGGFGSQLLMPSPNLLKSKKKFTRGLAEKFPSFRAKKVPGNGFGVPSGSRIKYFRQIPCVFRVWKNEHSNSLFCKKAQSISVHKIVRS